MHQYIYQTLGLPTIYLSEEGRDIASMAIQRYAAPSIIRELARDCYKNGDRDERQRFQQVLREITALIEVVDD